MSVAAQWLDNLHVPSHEVPVGLPMRTTQWRKNQKIIKNAAKTPDAAKSPLEAAIHAGSLGEVKKLVASGASPDLIGWRGLTMLMLAAYFGKPEIFKFLASKTRNYDFVTSQNFTLLMAAAIGGNADIVRWVLKNSQIPLSHKNNTGETALVYAAGNRRIEILEILLAGDTLFLGVDPPPYKNDALFAASESGYADVVRYLLDRQKANYATYLHAMLMKALWGGKMDIAKVLVEHGADINQDPTGTVTFLNSRLFYGHHSDVEAARELGMNLEAVADYGKTVRQLVRNWEDKTKKTAALALLDKLGVAK
ncbi:MAG: hypothetical protein DRR15_17595 [Gammaproteobacteria bacterium]|nr:MAG: hypothetical protein DRR15_17595 [Gammaproteobacteria bacterium]